MFLFVERNTLIQQRKGKKNYHCTTVFFSLHKVHILISYVNIICILKKKGVGFILYEKKEKNTCKRDFSNQPCRKCINSRFLLIQQQKKKKKNCTKTKVSLLIQLKKIYLIEASFKKYIKKGGILQIISFQYQSSNKEQKTKKNLLKYP